MAGDIIGKTIDGYQITELIGRGGMGVVYKAKDLKLERDVALKSMGPFISQDQVFMRRFRTEAQALARLRNDHIVSVFQLCETESELGVFIAMEFAHGMTLAEMIKRKGPLPEDYVLRLFRQILNAFDHAHRAGVIHRDIKPGNIIVSDAGEVKVTDFGLARIQRATSATVTQLSGGTIFYASPEQLEGLGKVDQRGDIYSLGMTLYEALSGKLPFDPDSSDFGIRKAIVEGSIMPLRKARTDISPGLSDIVMKAIAVRPGDRYQTAAEMQEALDRFAATRKQQPERRFVISKSFLKIEYGLISVALLGLLGYGLYQWFSRASHTENIQQDTVQKPPPAAIASSTLSINASPKGAELTIGGNVIGHSPVEGLRIDTGKVKLKVAKNGYRSLDTVLSVRPGSSTRLYVTLVPMTSNISILTAPKGASVTIGGVQAGLSPVLNRKIPVGNTSFAIKMSGYKNIDTTVRIGPDPSMRFEFTLLSLASSITVETLPPGAKVIIDGNFEGNSPVRDRIVSAGKTPVRIKKSGYADLDTTIMIGAGRHVKLSFALVPVAVQLGLVDFVLNVAQSGASVSIDGVAVHGPLPFHAKPGLRTVSVQYGTQIWEKQIQFLSGQKVTVNVDFKRKVKLRVVAFESDGETPILGASIAIDGKTTGRYTPVELDVPLGVHQVAVDAEGHEMSQPKRKVFEDDGTLSFVLRKKGTQ